MSIFPSYLRRPAKPNLLPNIKYFQIIFEDLFIFQLIKTFIKRKIIRITKKEIEIFRKKSFGFGKKSAPRPKSDLGLGRTLS